MERRRSGGSLPGGPEAAAAGATAPAATASRRARAAGQSVLDVSDVSITSMATSVPSSAGGAFEQEMQRRILAMESKLKDVDGLIKEQTQVQNNSEEPSMEQMQEELDEMARYRQTLQARASGLEEVLQKERQEHQAALEQLESTMNRSIEALQNSIEHSVAESTSIMKARMVEADGLVRKVVNHMNHKFQKPKDQAGLAESFEQLREEHDQLIRKHNELMAKRTDFVAGAGISIPTWQGYVKAPAITSAPMVVPPVDSGARSPGRISPPVDSPLRSGPSGSPHSSPTKSAGKSPQGSRSPQTSRGTRSPRSPRALSPRSPQGPVRNLPWEEELCTTGMSGMRFANMGDVARAVEGPSDLTCVG